MAQRKYKMMSFETAIRNPERYQSILVVLSRYEGKKLSDDLVLNIMLDLCNEGIVTYKDLDIEESDENKKEYIKNKVSHKADGGFPEGYMARFWTYLRTIAELGFVYARYNEKLLISDMAKLLLRGEISDNEAFAMQIVKHNRYNPYKRVSNDFNYFRFLFELLSKLDENGKKLSLVQFSVSLFSKTSKVETFIKILEKNKFGSKKDLAYKYLKEKVEKDAKSAKVPQESTVFNDYSNTVLRVMKLAGMISLVNDGILLVGINEYNREMFNKLFSTKFKLTPKEKKEPIAYFQKVGAVDDNMLQIILENRTENAGIDDEYGSKLEAIYAKYFDSELKITECIVNMKLLDRTEFVHIPDSLKLELLISLFIKKCYGEAIVKPNYKADQYGFPYSHAPGKKGDIEVVCDKINWLIEVSMIRNKDQQINNETINLFRHLSDTEKKQYLSLVVPYVHDDTKRLINAATLIMMLEKEALNLFSASYTFKDFIEVTEQKKNFTDMEEKTVSFVNEIKAIIV